MAWAIIGVAQSGCLYETCFAFLTRRLGRAARGAIARVTLVAGLAGTLAFPLGHWLGDRMGGQGAMLWLAGLAPLLIFLFAVGQGIGAGLTSNLRPMLIGDLLGRRSFGATIFSGGGGLA